MKNASLWIIFTLILVSALSIHVASFLATSPSLQPIPKCIEPRPHPRLITQSGTICPGTYPYGIGVASNVNIDCQGRVNFNGSIGGLNGLTISSVRNVTVKGCNFMQFAGDGIFIGNSSNHTTDIHLVNVKSIRNLKNGIFVGHNVVNIEIRQSNISENGLDGILFRANHLGKVFPGATVFARGIVILNNKIIDNHQNGINFDSSDYFDYGFNSPSIITRLNNSINVENNTLKNNWGNGIQSVGLVFASTSYYNMHSQIVKNLISSNGLQLNGSGIAIIGNRSARLLNDPYAFSNFNMGFGHIHSNDIINNSKDGISLEMVKLPVTSLSNLRPSCLSTGNVFANSITGNKRNGISFRAIADNNYVCTAIFALQNDISNNGKEGAYIIGHNSVPYSTVKGNFMCNDILSNGALSPFKENGIDIKQFNEGWITINAINIIENNLVGIVVGEIFSGTPNVFWSGTNINQNSIGFNSAGLFLNGTRDIGQVNSNDFSQNTVIQAVDTGLHPFIHNWWSDYSPTCIDSPQNGYCDINRPIPFANEDVQPKAGHFYGWKFARNYFVKASVGVVPKTTCQMYSLPSPPIIISPQSENSEPSKSD